MTDLPYEIGVHVAHCCFMHGCKYGDDEDGGCPVATGEYKQETPCEYCETPDEVQQRIDDLSEELNWAISIYGREPGQWDS